MRIFPHAAARWLSGDRILFSASQEAVDSLWTVQFSMRGTSEVRTQRLTFGTSIDQHPAASEGPGHKMRVAFSSVSRKVDLWLLPIDADRGKVTGGLTKLTRGAGTASTQLTISRDGKRIAFFSDRNGTPQPWVLDLPTGKLTNVGVQGSVWGPNLSPDGLWLAWSVFDKVSGKPDQTVRASVSPGGQVGLAEPLCQNCGPIASWSPDGRSVIYNKPNPSRAFLLELDTGRSYDLLAARDADVWGGRFSPDGKWLTMNQTPSPAKSQIFIAPFDPERRGPVPSSEWIPVTDGTGWDDKSRWSPDSKSMYFVSERDGFRCIWWQKLDPVTRRPAGPATPIVHFHESRLSLRNVAMGPLAVQVAPDKLIVSLGELTGNVWILGPDLP